MAGCGNSLISDSTDWLNTPLSSLTAVEAALRCQVCKDLFKTPMITSCSHTFCSVCIRRALASDSRCPLCRTAEQELKLRPNWSMEEAVDAFDRSRASLLAFARASQLDKPLSSAKRKLPKDYSLPEQNQTYDRKRLRSSARLASAHTAQKPYQEVDGDDGDGAYRDSVETDSATASDTFDDGLVPCPVCQDRMKQWQVFKHLDVCSRPSSRALGASGDSSRTPASFLVSPARDRQAKAIDRLPALNYSMVKDQALRKKMSELGISSLGSRTLLERRHREWSTIWNANCDSARPRKKSELVQDLDTWERAQGSRASTSSSGAVFPRDKGFDGAAWGTKHDVTFRSLIVSAKSSYQQPKSDEKSAQPVEEDATEKFHFTDRPSSPHVSIVTSSIGDVIDMEECPPRETPALEPGP